MGDDNTVNGFQALANNTTGSSNIGLGRGAGSGVTTADDVICIGAAGADVSHSCYIGNIFNQPSPSGLAVFVNSDGKLGTISRPGGLRKTLCRWTKPVKLSWHFNQ